MAISIGTHLGSVQITALLGRGGFGEVYRARDTKLKRGRLDESLAEFLKARELDPLSPIIARGVAAAYYLKRDHMRALELLRQANELGPAFSVPYEIGMYIQNRLFNEALAELDKAEQERKGDPLLIFSRGIV